MKPNQYQITILSKSKRVMRHKGDVCFRSSLRPECWMALMIQATHCVLPDEAIISLGPADWGQVYPSLYFYASVFFLFFSLYSFLYWVSTCAPMWCWDLLELMLLSPKLDTGSRIHTALSVGKSLRHFSFWHSKLVYALATLVMNSICHAFIITSLLQVLIEAMVSRDRRGYIAIDDIMVLNYPCCKCHFRLWTASTECAGGKQSFSGLGRKKFKAA